MNERMHERNIRLKMREWKRNIWFSEETRQYEPQGSDQDYAKETTTNDPAGGDEWKGREGAGEGGRGEWQGKV